MMRELGGVFGIAVVVAVFAAAGSYASPCRRSPTASTPAILRRRRASRSPARSPDWRCPAAAPVRREGRPIGAVPALEAEGGR